MFGKNSNWLDKLKEKLTAYVDERFEDYRERLAEDLSKGLATLAGLIAIWTVGVLCFTFSAIVLSLLLSELLRPLVGNWAYLLGFFSITLAIGGAGWWLIKNKIRYIEKPVYLDMMKSLGGIIPEEPAAKGEASKTAPLPPALPLKNTEKGPLEEKKS